MGIASSLRFSQCWVDGPLTASGAKLEICAEPAKETSAMYAITIGLEIAKSVLQVRAEDAAGRSSARRNCAVRR